MNVTLKVRTNQRMEAYVCSITTAIDIILANDGCFSMVGQIDGGLPEVVQRAMVKSSPHIWFEISEVRLTPCGQKVEQPCCRQLNTPSSSSQRFSMDTFLMD
eukprot:XP_013984324.1 PREDICTED: glycerol-3-phosphate acyltransferase 3-like [Salmo salar]